MKNLITLLAAVCLTATVNAQKINYQKNFDTALDKARNEKKLLFVAIMPSDAISRRSFSNSAINNPQVVSLYNKNFVSYTISISDSASLPLRKRYHTTAYPTYVFIDGRGNMLYKETGSSTSPDKYIGMSQKAIACLASGKTLSNYDDRYQQGKVDTAFLKDYITLRESLNIYDNARLADEYVDLLTIKSFNDYNTVLFVLEAGPYVHGKAYNLCYTNHRLVDSIYKKESVALRVAINARIISNTFNAAIEKRDNNMAQQAASYIVVTSRKNIRRGVRESENRMLTYFKAVKDTASYYRRASNFYDNYYMNISADSAQKVREATMAGLKQNLIKRNTAISLKKNLSPADTQKRVKITETVSTMVNTDIANVLNNAAYDFYYLGTANQTYLAKALLWSKRAIQLKPFSGYYDTQAHLLYRLGFYDEAFAEEKKAVDMSSNETTTLQYVAHLKAELSKMKNRQL